MIKKVTTAALAAGLLFAGSLSVMGSAEDTYNNTNKFLRWRVDNEYVMSVQNADPFYGAKVLLEKKYDNIRVAQRWDYDSATKQIYGINDYCVGVGGQYEIMLKDCEETLTHTEWDFDELGRMVGSVNVTGVREALCVDGVQTDLGVEMIFVDCSDTQFQQFELESYANTAYYNDIVLRANGENQDTVFNEITTDQDLEILRDAVQALGVEEILRTSELTVFAPTDEAFEKLGTENVNALLMEENQEILLELVGYHVTDAITAQKLVKQAGVHNIYGDHLQLIDNKINGVAAPIQTDITARNGYVHKIDTVLIPPSLEELLSY